ncbi:hypothetical protein IU443_18610 [Nocardia farcinica]|uniref:hypothetical protein n=1 Tax=Nocardia farcinica TaxID=37329 RepID=UPI001896151E|nr:hypothetical protein [Nocardia farcinica]MBF6264325.1 hypothetical protein [Nocardia farcinica]MBF6282525.1 hypothetical protein [Nocardia farcinica]MBF6307645.1 hypothetical protein [Nocardia farcinica]MBF6391960.1 hypothetical protein [Nocardia farcinica]MBF6489896.1 hypothetical protein [Nocardia farcinica]
MSTITAEVVHNLCKDPGDLLPFCGTVPGPDPETANWHTGPDRDLLVERLPFALPSCVTCLFPDALGDWTRLTTSEPAHVRGAEGPGTIRSDQAEQIGWNSCR